MPRAEKELLAVAEYVANEFGTSHALALVAKIEQWDAWLAENPEIARVEPMLIHKKKHVYRSLVIKPHTKLILFIEGGKVFVADLWDMRRDPKTLIRRVK